MNWANPEGGMREIAKRLRQMKKEALEVGYEPPYQMLRPRISGEEAEAILAAYPEEPVDNQIERLACFIQERVPGEPSRSEGAVDCAIRLLSAAYPEEPKEENPRFGRCSCCDAVVDERDPLWRRDEKGRWEHRCPGLIPQAGYFPAEEKECRHLEAHPTTDSGSTFRFECECGANPTIGDVVANLRAALKETEER